MKKIFAIILTIILILNFNIVFAESFNVVVENKDANPGETVEVKISLENNSGILAALFNLEYDTNRLRLTNVVDNKLLAGGFFSPSYSSYPYKMIWNSSSYENFTQDGTLATLTFQVLKNAEKGEAFINLSYDADDVFDVDLNNVDLNLVNGTINVLVSGMIDSEENTEEDYEDDPEVSIEDVTSSFEGIITTPPSSTPPSPDTIEKNDNEINDFKFSDVSNSDWFFESVKFVYENKLMNGTSANLFSPNSNITRGMFVTVLYRIENDHNDYENSFTDVTEDAYYSDAVSWASENGIVNGTTATTFSPDNNITREQIATILHRYIKYKNEIRDDLNYIEVETEFNDFNTVSKYAVEAITYSVKTGLINGKNTNLICPHDFATRAEIATIFKRYLNLK